MTDDEFYGGVVNLKQVKLQQKALLDIYKKKVEKLEDKVSDLERAFACIYIILCRTVKAQYDVNLEKALAGDQQVNLSLSTKGGRLKVSFETVFEHGVNDERPEPPPETDDISESEETGLEDGKID